MNVGKKLNLKEIQEVELNIMREFHSFCEKYNLKYVLDGGTLLGAIRHNGFIPWDDDIDVSMPYPDYLNFLKLFEENNLNPDLLAMHDMVGNIGIHYTKLVDLRTICLNPARDDKHRYSVFIDIFPMMSIEDNDEEALNRIKKILELRKKSWKFINFKTHNPIKYLYRLIFGNIKLKKIVSEMEKICQEIEYGTTSRIRCVPAEMRTLIPADNDHFENRILKDFESYCFYIPNNYDKYLRNMYGDYMQLPPENKRYTHELDAYWRN